ncbi:hypothetical protein SeMB42_g06547 [Synchytrium endobioticum]|uniref:CTLH domain-containing protein n=1 Tax=Synchytrium endobioticum TaxID=286115 RepID=A0A507CLG8_9FUNG|nr:hypothetical protein SeMB42_g06547 [Synchytrium endobioticum]
MSICTTPPASATAPGASAAAAAAGRISSDVEVRNTISGLSNNKRPFSNSPNGAMVIDDEGDLTMDDATYTATTAPTTMSAASRKLLLAAAQRSNSPSSQPNPSPSTTTNTSTSAVSSLDSRKALYQLVVQGRIPEARTFCHKYFPDALNGETPESEDVGFQLQCQQFIECVRNSAPDALNYAQEEMTKYYAMGEKYIKTLNEVIALLAYTDPEHSPLSEYLSLKHREDVAMALNSQILAYDQLPPQTSLERLVRQTTVVRTQLEDMGRDTTSKKSSASSGSSNNKGQVHYPHWSLAGFLAGLENQGMRKNAGGINNKIAKARG